MIQKTFKNQQHQNNTRATNRGETMKRTTRKCRVCNGTGYITLSYTQKILEETDKKLSEAGSLPDQILLICESPQTVDFVKALLTRLDSKIDKDWIHYNMLNMADEGLLSYDEKLDRYKSTREE